MNRPALERLRARLYADDSWGAAVTREELCAVLDALLAPDASPSEAEVSAYLTRMEGHDRDYAGLATYERAQADMWHRMALAQAVAGLANWSA